MVNYQLGKIYKIVDNTNENIYIGSTCEKYLSKRLNAHVLNYRKYLNKKYQNTTSFDIIKNGSYDIVLVEEFPCESKMQLHARKRHYIETNECLNKIHPLRTSQEYYQTVKDTWRYQKYPSKDEYNAIRREQAEINKDEINAKRRENYKLKKQALLTVN